MEIRPVQPADLADLIEIDGTIESTRYLHLDRAGGGGLESAWKLTERPLRQKRIEANRLDEGGRNYLLKHIVGGAEEGLAVLAEHDGQKVALVIAQVQPEHGTMRLEDLRVDFDHRRQGLATALLYNVRSEEHTSELQ